MQEGKIRFKPKRWDLQHRLLTVKHFDTTKSECHALYNKHFCDASVGTPNKLSRVPKCRKRSANTVLWVVTWLYPSPSQSCEGTVLCLHSAVSEDMTVPLPLTKLWGDSAPPPQCCEWWHDCTPPHKAVRGQCSASTVLWVMTWLYPFPSQSCEGTVLCPHSAVSDDMTVPLPLTKLWGDSAPPPQCCEWWHDCTPPSQSCEGTVLCLHSAVSDDMTVPLPLTKLWGDSALPPQCCEWWHDCTPPPHKAVRGQCSASTVLWVMTWLYPPSQSCEGTVLCLHSAVSDDMTVPLPLTKLWGDSALSPQCCEWWHPASDLLSC